MPVSSEKRRLIENFFSLSILQGANYILPLITVPYLVRVLGPGNYGVISFAQAFVQYFVIFTDYGFNLSATRKISVFRESPEKIQRIFNAVIFIKTMLALLSVLCILLIVTLVGKFQANKSVYFFTTGMILGNLLFPVWLFQGLEKMRYITLLNVLGRMLYIALVFSFVHKQTDFLYVPLLNSICLILSGLLSLVIINNIFGIKLKKVSMADVWEEAKEGWHAFVSTLAISLYTVSNTFILGLFASNTVVGYYSAGEKIIKAFLGMLSPVSQAVYPYTAKYAHESPARAVIFIRKLLLIVGGVSLALSFFLFFLSGLLVKIILGGQYGESILVVKYLSFLVFIIALSNIFGIQTMLNFQMKKQFSQVLITAGIINILMAVLLVPHYQHIGTCISVLITEMFVTIAMFITLQRHGIYLLTAGLGHAERGSRV